MILLAHHTKTFLGIEIDINDHPFPDGMTDHVIFFVATLLLLYGVFARCATCPPAPESASPSADPRPLLARDAYVSWMVVSRLDRFRAPSPGKQGTNGPRRRPRRVEARPECRFRPPNAIAPTGTVRTWGEPRPDRGDVALHPARVAGPVVERSVPSRDAVPYLRCQRDG